MNSAIKLVFACYLSAFQNLTNIVIQTTGCIVIHILGGFQCPLLLVKALDVVDAAAAVVAAVFVINA